MNQTNYICGFILSCQVGFFVFVFVFSGCDSPQVVPPPPPPKTTIMVSQDESTEASGITINFINLDSFNPPQVRLDNLEEIQDFKKQMEFLLQKLEETEKRMIVHEDVDPNTPVVPPHTPSAAQPLPGSR